VKPLWCRNVSVQELVSGAYSKKMASPLTVCFPYPNSKGELTSCVTALAYPHNLQCLLLLKAVWWPPPKYGEVALVEILYAAARFSIEV